MKTLSGKEWERLIDKRGDKDEANGLLVMDKCGVQVRFDPRTRTWQPISSFPDREGALPGGRQFIFDAKAISGSSLSMQPDKTRPRQMRHLFRRGKVGCITFLLVHCNEKIMQTKTHEALTVALPVRHDLPLWQPFLDGESMSINRDTMRKHGILVPWDKASMKDRLYLPNLEYTIRQVAKFLDA